jgi:hypothetical protein
VTCFPRSRRKLFSLVRRERKTDLFSQHGE